MTFSPQPPAFDLTGLAALHRDDHPAPPSGVLGVPAFLSINLALDLPQFIAYLVRYDFGKVPPDGVCLHHTAIPDVSWARAPVANATWDAGEQGMPDAQIIAKRLRQLDAIKRYYQATLGWSAGPHLYIDDRAIYLLSPMAEPAIHAKWANSWHDSAGTLHYPIAIEVVGDYTRTPWPESVARLVGGAVAALQQRLGTFALRYLYPTPESKPGMRTLPDGTQQCAYPDRLRGGGISSHRDYNKPACPGNAITEAFYLAAIAREAAASTANAQPMTRPAQPMTRPVSPTLPPASAALITENAPLLSPPRCTLAQLHRALIGQPRRSYSDADIHETIIPAYWQTCLAGGIDPLLVLAQLIKETSERWPSLQRSPYAPLCSFWSTRPQRNPAGIGVNGKFAAVKPANEKDWAYNPDRRRWEQGLSFASWKDDAIPAHVGRLLAYALPLGQGTPAQQTLIARALRYRALPDALRGSAPTLKPLGKVHNPMGQGWASPGDDYGASIAALATQIAALP